MDIPTYEEQIALCAYKEDLSKAELGIQDIELELIDDFLRFLKWVKIIEPPMPGQTGSGIVPFKLLPHNRRLIANYLSQPLISVLKARQIWISTTTAAYVLWYAMTKRGANNLLFSKGQPEAKELLAKARRIYDLLPPFMKLKLDPDSTEELGFPSLRSSIKAFPSTPSAGISYTSSVIVMDEHAAHPYADENYISSKPTRDKGGQFISIFTADPWSNDNLATALFKDSLAGKNDFVNIFFPYDVVPGRDNEWYEKTKRNIPIRELTGLTPELYMAKNYPRSIEEALSTLSTVAAFNHEVLNRMAELCRNPIEKEGIDSRIVHVYKEYLIGEPYIAASDTSHGVGKDFNVTTIMDVRTGEVVADIMDNHISPEELALHTVHLLMLYHNPLWYPEDNDWGRTTINTAQTLGYRNFGYQDDKRTKVGWHTDEKTRLDLFGQLIPAVNNGQITIYNKDGLRQMYDIIRNASKNGRIEATSDGHDDYSIALGICWANRHKVDTVFESKPIPSLDFGKEDVPDIVKRWINR